MPIDSITRRHVLILAAAGSSFACSGRPLAQLESTATANESAGKWRTGPALPAAVQEIYPALHQGQIHLAGGFVSDGNTIIGATDRHIALDPIEGVWLDRAPLPVARHHPNLVSFANRLFAIGGFEARSEQAVWVMQTGIWSFDGETWSAGSDLPQPNGESVTAVLNDQLHVCGGRAPKASQNASWTDHSDVADHFILADASASWTRAAPLPTPRNSAAAAPLGQDWHVVGGRTVAGGNTPAHEVYDAQEDRWRTAAPMPQAQGGLAAASVGGRIFAFGGEYFDTGGGVFPNAWVYTPETDTWAAIEDMPHPRHGLGAVAFSNEIYLIGGAREVGGNQTSNLVEIYTPA